VIQHWSAGDLSAFAPSADGSEPTDGEGMEIEPGPYAVRVGKRTALNNNTNFAHLMQAIVDCGKEDGLFTVKMLNEAGGSLSVLEGLDAHWNRVPQKKRAGMVEEEGETKQRRDVLVVTKIYGYGDEEAPTKGAKKKKAAPVTTKSNKVTGKKAKPVKEDEEDEADEEEDEASELSPLDQKVAEALVSILDDAPGNKIKKGKLANAMLTAAGKDKDKSKMVKRCTEDEFLGLNAGWAYDEDSGLITKAGDDEDEDEE
jgi:hypothetical protein